MTARSARQLLAAAGIALATVSMLCACTTPGPFIQLDPNTGQPQATDAKVRTILTFPPKTVGVPGTVVCAEPSPDVAEAVSTALTASLQVELQNAKNAQGSLGGSLSHTTSESVAELGERLATIQLLRDKMYRACEAYGNGAIKPTAYALILARHDKTMMSLLSNELAAGAFGRALASIGAGSTISGPDPGALKNQEDDVKAKTASVQADIDAKKDATADFKALSESLGVLLALDAQSVTSSTTIMSNGSLGTISGSRLPDVQTIAEIHRNYIDDDGIDPLTDACIIGMEALDENQTVEQRAASTKAMDNYRLERAMLLQELQKAEQDRDDATGQQVLAQATIDAIMQRKTAKLGALSTEDVAALEEAQKNYRFFKATAESKDRLVTETQQSIQQKGDPLQDLFLAKGSPFAAFCYQSVLNTKSDYVKTRLQQKIDLRQLDPTTNEIAARRLALCAQVLDKPVDATFTADLKQKAIAAQCGSTTSTQLPAAPPTVLTAPTNVKATSAGGKISVTFTAPKDANISGYTATATNVDAGKGETPLTGTGTPTTKSITITGCKDAETYDVDLEVTDNTKAKATAKAGAPVTCKAAAAPTKPSAPTIKTATSKSNTITITFDAPADGGSPITGYTATATRANAAKDEIPLTGNSKGTQTSVDISKCLTGDEYSVTVVAINKIKASEASKSSNVACNAAAATPSDFPPPTNLSVKSSANTFVVSFDAPKDPKTPVTGYSASAANDTSKDRAPLSENTKAAGTGVVIPGCITGDSYTITAVANYAAGKSEPAMINKQPCKK
jgi:hypothetical protein